MKFNENQLKSVRSILELTCYVNVLFLNNTSHSTRCTETSPKPTLNVHDLWSMRWCFITNIHICVSVHRIWVRRSLQGFYELIFIYEWRSTDALSFKVRTTQPLVTQESPEMRHEHETPSASLQNKPLTRKGLSFYCMLSNSWMLIAKIFKTVNLFPKICWAMQLTGV